MNKFLKKQWPLIAMVLLLTGVVFYVLRQKETPPPAKVENNTTEASSDNGLKLKDIHYTHDNPEKHVKWILDAKEVIFSNDRTTIFFNDFTLRFKPEGKQSFKLTGKHGTYFRKKGKLDIKGDLRGLSENGYRIFTEHVLVDEKVGTIHGKDPVKIIGPSIHITGKGLFVNIKKSRFKILSDVTTRISRPIN